MTKLLRLGDYFTYAALPVFGDPAAAPPLDVLPDLPAPEDELEDELPEDEDPEELPDEPDDDEPEDEPPRPPWPPPPPPDPPPPLLFSR